MKRKLLLFCILAFAAIAVSAQNNLVIRNFKYDQYDQTANLKGTQKKDNNGRTAALLKIETNLDNLAFDGGSYGIVTTQHKTGQWWVYVPERAQKITIGNHGSKNLHHEAYPGRYGCCPGSLGGRCYHHRGR